MTTDTAPPPSPCIDIFVVSHTNVGKTSLVRTLLGQDVGEVEDAPDVTQALAAYDLVVAPDGGALRLWDTPGFGDSFRLAGRLRRKQRWLAWLVREVWDRRFHPALWRGQRLALELRARASVVLYPVNLLESPVDAVYVVPELEILAWVGKPVLVLLNQGGDQGAGDRRAAEWRHHLGGFPVVQRVLGLDGYTRCWLQELALFNEIGQVLPESDRPAYHQLALLLGQGYRRRFDASVEALAEYLLRLSSDTVEMDARWFDGIKDAWKSVRARIPGGRNMEQTPFESGMQSLAQRYAEQTKSVTDKLIALHRLDGVSAAEIMEMANGKLAIHKPVDASSSALAGGVVSGILTGLAADLLTGGLSLGTGALVGGIMGALGGAALARGYNVYTHKDKKIVRWSADSLTEALGKATMLYLSIAHFGRGQGQWRRKKDPLEWAAAVQAVLLNEQAQIAHLWSQASALPPAPQVHAQCAALVQTVLRNVLLHLYPDAGVILPRVDHIVPPVPLPDVRQKAGSDPAAGMEPQ